MGARGVLSARTRRSVERLTWWPLALVLVGWRWAVPPLGVGWGWARDMGE